MATVQVTNNKGKEPISLFRANKDGLFPDPTISRSRMRSGLGKDPVSEELLREINPSIGEGVDVMRCDEFSLIRKYETELERQCHENDANGEGYVTDSYLHIYGGDLSEGLSDEYYNEIFDESPHKDYYEEVKIPPYHFAGSSVTGYDGTQYTEVFEVDPETGVQSLSYLDTPLSCNRVEAAEAKPLGVVESLAVMTPDFDKNYKMVADKDGNMQVVEQSQSEKAVNQAIADMNKPYLPENLYSLGLVERAAASANNDASFTTAAGPAVKTNVKAGEAFNTAATADKPAPVTSLVGFRTPTALEQLKEGTKVADPATQPKNDPVYTLTSGVAGGPGF